MHNHTPGPWSVGDHSWNIKSDSGLIASAHFGGYQPNEKERAEVGANARLIAAAPDLLAALVNILKDDRAWQLDPTYTEAARAAIAKAS